MYNTFSLKHSQPSLIYIPPSLTHSQVEYASGSVLLDYGFTAKKAEDVTVRSNLKPQAKHCKLQP